MSERWLPVVGYEGFYLISSKGRVKTVQRLVRRCIRQVDGFRLLKSRVLKPWNARNKRGMVCALQVDLSKLGVVKTFNVHSLVLAAFVGPRPENMEGCHEDGDPVNNCVENLRYDTHVNNEADKGRHGTVARGSKNGSAKLTERDVVDIRNLFAVGRFTIKELGEMYESCQIRSIVSGNSWKHAGGPVKKRRSRLRYN